MNTWNVSPLGIAVGNRVIGISSIQQISHSTPTSIAIAMPRITQTRGGAAPAQAAPSRCGRLFPRDEQQRALGLCLLSVDSGNVTRPAAAGTASPKKTPEKPIQSFPGSRRAGARPARLYTFFRIASR
jgi:hypothetical protein